MTQTEVWMPTLNDIEYWKAEGTAEEQAYFSDFGWEKLVVPAALTYLTARMTTLKTRFVERYGFRMLGAETMEKWQIRLQNRFDEMADEWERAYEMYSDNASAMDADIKPGKKTTVSGTDQLSGSDTTVSGSTAKSIDTPDSAVNDDDDYADRVNKSSGSASTTYGKKNTVARTETEEETGVLIETINRNIDAYRDLDTKVIEYFENNFMNVFWY